MKTDEKGLKQIEPVGINAVLVEAIQEQEAKIEARDETIAALQSRLDAMDQRLASLDRPPASPWASSMGLGGPIATPALFLLGLGFLGERLLSARRAARKQG